VRVWFWELIAMAIVTGAFVVQIRSEPYRWRHWLFLWCIWMILIILLSRTIAKLFHLI
jgi:hypothetical protein